MVLIKQNRKFNETTNYEGHREGKKEEILNSIYIVVHKISRIK